MFVQELVFDTVLGAFYKNRFQELEQDSPYLIDYIVSPDYTRITGQEPVYDRFGDLVVTDLTIAVYTERRSEIKGQTRLRYLAVQGLDFTAAFYKDLDFKDWASSDGEGKDAEAFMITGFETVGDTQRRKQSPYITCHFQRTEGEVRGSNMWGVDYDNASSCLMQTRWDYADHSNSGKLGPYQQVYRMSRKLTPNLETSGSDYGQSVITSKNKVRGRGRALSIVFRTEPGKNLKMYGWGVKFAGNENV